MPSPTILNTVDSAELARCLFEESNDGLFIFDPESMQILDVNPHAQRMTKYSRRELLQLSVPDLLETENAKAAQEFFDSCVETRLLHSRESYQLVRNTGGKLEVNVTVSRLHTSPSTLGLISVRDVSDRKALELNLTQARSLLQEALNAQTKQFEKTTGTLRKTESQLSEIVDDIDAIVWEAEFPCNTFSYVSAQAESILGYPVSDWETKPNFWYSLIHPDEADGVLSYCVTATKRCEDHAMEYRMLAADGDYRWIREIVHVVQNENNTPIKVRGLMIDITARRNAEDDRLQLERELRKRERELAHVARLSTMGEMVAGIAHEVNQPLTAISNFANAAIEVLNVESREAEDSVRQWMRQISNEAVRCSDIIRRLRGFTRKDDESILKVNVAEVIHNSVAMLSDVVQEHSIQMETSLSQHKDIFVMCNETQLQQVLINLLRNACDAVLNASARSPKIQIDLDVISDRVQLTVSDSGPGIPEDLAPQIFEPFFTSREDGMGMGLAISKSIVNEYGGTLKAENSATGARFIVELPTA